jgi:hypothetical protein
MPPVSNDRLTGAPPTPGSPSSAPTPAPAAGAYCETPAAAGVVGASSSSSPDVKVVQGDIPGARPVGAPGVSATSTTTSTTSSYTTSSAAGSTATPGRPPLGTPGHPAANATAGPFGAAAVPGGPADPCVPDPNYKPNPAKEAFARITHDLDELKEYAGYYVGAKVDGIKQSIRNIGLYAALGVLGAIVGGAIVATAAGLLVVGLAEALGNLFGGRYWLGDLVTGILILGLVGGGAYFMMNKLTGAWRTQTLKKYEQRKQDQRQRFDHDVTSRAREAAAAAAAARAEARRSGGQKGH